MKRNKVNSLFSFGLAGAMLLLANNTFAQSDLFDSALKVIEKETIKAIKQYDADNQYYNQPYANDGKRLEEPSKQPVNSQSKPRGNKKEFCEINTYNGVLPAANKGYGDDNLTLCYHGYTALYKNDYHISLWVAEKLSPEREALSQGGEREETFYPDPTVKRVYGLDKTIKTTDYTGMRKQLVNGELVTINARYAKDLDQNTIYQYDRGHLSPSRNNELGGDRFESFYTSNIVPQTAENNRNIWKNIETFSRCLVTKYNTDVYTVTIPAIDIKKYQQTQTQPASFVTKEGNTIIVPDKMAKAIYIPKLNIAGVYLTNNDKSKTYYEVVTLDDLRKYAFIDPFPFLDKESPLRTMKPSQFTNPNRGCR